MTAFGESVQLILRTLRRFLSLSLILAGMILTVRLYELVIISNFSNYPSGSTIDLLTGLKFDLIIFLRICAILMVPYLFIGWFSQRAAKYFFMIISLLLILGDILLVKYFSTARVPLGADLLGYSFKEMQHTVGASGELNILPYLLSILYLAWMARVFVRHVYWKLKPWMTGCLTALMLLSLLPLKPFRPEPSKFANEFSMFVTCNKFGFFVQSMSDHYLNQGSLNNKTFTFKAVATSPEGNPFVYTDPDYPFLHQETTPDVLSQYFKPGETPPNIVLIIVESLGRAYSGQGAYLGSFTPCLDSLMEQSLYWENCLSTSGRTFQVLPATLASVPFGDHGFAALGEKMPDHLSLISLLKKQVGYTSTFSYGGESEFDKMDIFLRRQGIDRITDSRSFGPGYTKLPATGNGFTWGYGDRDIFGKYMELRTASPDSLRLDVILTLAMHDPFNIPNQEYFIQKFEERLKALDISEKTKAFDRQYSKQLATVLYFDESLRYFFTEYRKLKSFENTIFIITGDHRMPEIPISTQIDRFHVPLVIYSPLLRKSEKFSSICSHFDITPSVLALLNGQGFIRRPSVAAWMGHGLDNSVAFRGLNTYPFMRNVNEMLDMVSSTNFLSGQTAYEVYPDLNIEPLETPGLAGQLKEELDNFLRKNNYACRNNRLIPDSLKTWTLRQ